VGDKPGGFATRAEQCELDALRGRAYAEDADIFDDVSALARLRELEDRLRVEHFAAPREWTAEFSLAMLHARSATASESPGADPLTSAPDGPAEAEGLRAAIARGSRSTAMRWHEALVASTAAVGVLLAAAAWASDNRAPNTGLDTAVAASAAGLGAMTYADLYDLHLENLREELLSGPGMDEVVDRFVPDQVRPQGLLYGRAVGTGPTRDREFCMIVADTPAPAVACISADEPERTVSVILPPASADSSDSPPAVAEFVKYTLSTEGIVVAEPLHPAPKTK
jgi:hypothetical protein